MFTFIAIVAGSAVIISGVVAVAYTATKIKNDLDAANSAIADLEASTDIVTSNVRNKVKLTSDGEKIIGLKDGSLVKAQPTLTTVDFDTSTYGDRAVLQLRNNTGSSITLTGLSIRGKPVKQLSGANGYVWEYSDYDDIEKNGENFVEVSNDFIFSPFQAKSIGDFVWKELHPHKMYSLTLIGTQYQYEIGQIWHLTLSYSLDGHTMEDIDTDVEVMGVSLSRPVGGVGATALNLRVPSSAWELTLSKNAKLVGAGNSQRLANRSNTVTVASSTWTGQADYFCDGVNDEVEIQAAIDYLNTIGGGNLVATSGTFNFTNKIYLYSGVSIIGNTGTIFNNMQSFYISNYDVAYPVSYCSVSFIRFTMTGNKRATAIDIACNNCVFSNLTADYTSSTTSYSFIGINGSHNIVKDSVIDTGGNNGGIYISGSYNTIQACSVYGAGSSAFLLYNEYNKITGCIASSCGSGIQLDSVSSNVATSNTITGCNLGINIIRYNPYVSDNNTVSGNYVNGGSYGILVGTGCNNNVITGNRVTGASVSSFYDIGTGTINSGNSFV